MNQCFNVAVATDHDIISAVVFSYIASGKASDKDTVVDSGKVWRSLTINEAWRTFPYVSGQTIMRAIKQLRTDGVIEAKMLGTSKSHRALYYTVGDNGKAYMEGGR